MYHENNYERDERDETDCDNESISDEIESDNGDGGGDDDINIPEVWINLTHNYAVSVQCDRRNNLIDIIERVSKSEHLLSHDMQYSIKGIPILIDQTTIHELLCKYNCSSNHVLIIDVVRN